MFSQSLSEFLGKKKILCPLLVLNHDTLDAQFIVYCRDAKIFQKPKSYLKIVGTEDSH